MPGGRPPKPTALKALANFPGRRQPNSDEPQLPVKKPVCPQWLNTDARRIWRRISKVLVQMRVLTKADEAALVSYAVIYARMQAAEQGLDKSGLIVKDDKGRPMASPYVRIADACHLQLLRISGEFGLTPASRAKTHAIPASESQDTSAEAAEAKAMQARLFGTGA